mmetsp:Transcript_90634/g.282222  ORF Transcript_90634/g.282222 Transcript_90634/m.282222 type:complete len:314 (+) Transcript_90634:93-1034(+)
MSAAGGPRLVVRNTFLEVFDDSQAAGDAEGGSPRRPRAQTDITDAKLPRKVSYPVDDPTYPLPSDALTSPATAGYGPVHIGGFPEEAHPAFFGKGGPPLLPDPSAQGGVAMPPFPGFGGPFPPPWGCPGMAPGAPSPYAGFPGMPWGYPPAPFPTAAVPQQQQQPGRGGGRQPGQGREGRQAGQRRQGRGFDRRGLWVWRPSGPGCRGLAAAAVPAQRAGRGRLGGRRAGARGAPGLRSRDHGDAPKHPEPVHPGDADYPARRAPVQAELRLRVLADGLQERGQPRLRVREPFDARGCAPVHGDLSGLFQVVI